LGSSTKVGNYTEQNEINKFASLEKLKLSNIIGKIND